MYLHIYKYTNIHIYIHIYIHIFIHIYVSICIYIYIYIWISTYIYIYLYVYFAYIYFYIYIYIYICISIFVYFHIYICIYIYTYIYTYICIYIDIDVYVKPDMHDKILQIPDQAWELDVAQQTADITAHLHRLLREGTDRTHRRCKKIYRDDEAWTLKNHKLATRKRIKATNGHLKRQLLQCCFSAWRTLRQPSTGPEEGDSEFCYGVTLRCRLVNLVAQFRAQCSHLKKVLI